MTWLMKTLRLPRSTASDRVLCDNAFNFAKNPRYNGYQPGLASNYIDF